MNRVKKIISSVLSVVMVLAMFTICASAAISPCYWYDKDGIEQGRGTIADGLKNITTDGILQINKDTELDAPMVITKSFRLQCDKDKIVSLKRAEGFEGNMLQIKSGKLSVKNIIIDGCGDKFEFGTEPMIKITGGVLQLNAGAILKNNKNLTANGGAVAVISESSGRDKARVVMNDGAVIEGNRASSGAGVYVTDGGAFTMNGGSIYGNTADFEGGAVYVKTYPSSFTMTDGKISGNKLIDTSAASSGAGVSFGDDTVGSFTGGSVTENKSDRGGVFVGSGANVTFGGHAYIWGNVNGDHQRNVYLASQKTNIQLSQAVSVTASFEKGAKIGISTNVQYADGSVVDYIKPNGFNINTYMFDDKSGYAYFMDGASSIHRASTLLVKYDASPSTVESDEQVFMAGNGNTFGFLPVPAGKVGSKFIGWVDDDGNTVTANSPVPEGVYEMNLTAEYKTNGALGVIGAFFERIGELMKMAFQFLQNLFMGGADKQI